MRPQKEECLIVQTGHSSTDQGRQDQEKVKKLGAGLSKVLAKLSSPPNFIYVHMQSVNKKTRGFLRFLYNNKKVKPNSY